MKLLDLPIKFLNFKNQETRKIFTWPKCIFVFLSWKVLEQNLKLTHNHKSSILGGAIIKKELSASGITLSCRVVNISVANKSVIFLLTELQWQKKTLKSWHPFDKIKRCLKTIFYSEEMITQFAQFIAQFLLKNFVNSKCHARLNKLKATLI